MLRQIIRVVKRIAYHPSNKGQIFVHLVRFFGWQIFKRLVRRPIVVESCYKRFLAYPDCVFSSAIMYFNIPEHNELSLLKSYSLEGKAVLFDIGANIGFYSIVMEEYFSAVHAFEPNPEAHRRLKENSTLNSSTIKANNLGVWDREGQRHLYVRSGADPTAHLEDIPNADTIPVPVVTLDGYIEENNIREKIVAKIDVEGGELKVLKGASQSLRQNRFSIIQFESLSEKHLASIMSFIKSLKYNVYGFNKKKLLPLEHRVEGVNNYFLLPFEG